MAVEAELRRLCDEQLLEVTLVRLVTEEAHAGLDRIVIVSALELVPDMTPEAKVRHSSPQQPLRGR